MPDLGNNLLHAVREHILHAVREHIIEAITIVLVYFFMPFKSIHSYRDWSEAEMFILSITLFIFSLSFLIQKLPSPSTLHTLAANTKNKFIYIYYAIIVSTLVSGLMAIVSFVKLHNKFITMRDPFFWGFCEELFWICNNYFTNLNIPPLFI